MKKSFADFAAPVLNSYSAIFFSQNRVLAALLIAVSFLHPAAGVSGLLCVLFSLSIVQWMGFNKDAIRAGLYSFNNLLIGIGFGTFYHLNGAFWIWLAIACILTTVITLVLSAWLGKYGLPVLSLPFIIVFWFILSALNGFPGMGLEQKLSLLVNEMYTGAIPHYPGLFFRSLSSILFQDNVLTGSVIALGLFIHSRIGFSLLVLSFIAACLFNSLTGTYPGGLSHYHLGANFMMTGCAIGGFFLVPSPRSFLWALVSIPICFLLVNSLSTITDVWHIPVFSLPFSLTTLALLYFFMLRIAPASLHLTPFQHYSPEKNLYQFTNRAGRLFDLNYFKLSLPFMGSWKVSQGYDGDITHKGDWSKAVDFVITDSEGRTHQVPGASLSDFYCYNKPVTACADGTIEEVINHIEDNPVGHVNTGQNWGNTVVIKHLNGLYSKVSHLKKGSIRVKAGEYVKSGDVLGSCGNSGRSPEPHIHFQMQVTPFIGSRTLSYPFSYFAVAGIGDKQDFRSFEVPEEGAVVSVIEIDPALKQALDIPPGYIASVSDGTRTESWEVFTDAFNSSYLFCKETGATAWFINNGTVFYFTHFDGPRDSLLYGFYRAAYKIILTTTDGIRARDTFPLDNGNPTPVQWLNDLLAPFYTFIRRDYSSYSLHSGEAILTRSKSTEIIAGRRKDDLEGEILVKNRALHSFTFTYRGKKTEAKWILKD